MICDWPPCPNEFTPPKTHPNQRFCSLDCRRRHNRALESPQLARELGHWDAESSGYTPQRPRVSTAPPLASCEHCRAWGTIHAEFCPNRRRRDTTAAHRVAVEVARSLAAGYQIAPTVASALLAWLGTEEAKADPDVMMAAGCVR